MCSGGEGLEGDGTEVMPWGEVDGRVERGGEATEQGNGRFGATFLDAFDVVLGHRSARSDLRNGQAQLGGLLNVPERDACVESGGDKCVPRRAG